jgi:hypothetical protein
VKRAQVMCPLTSDFAAGTRRTARDTRRSVYQSLEARRKPESFWGAPLFRGLQGVARTATACSMSCCPPGLHEAWPPGGWPGKDPGAPASVSASRAGVATAREWGTLAVWGAKGGASTPGEAWPLSPLAGLSARRRASSQRARTGASRHLVVGVDVRPDPDHDAESRRRRVCAARRARAKSQSGQERPRRRRRCAAPALTPEGVAPALFATSAKVPRRQTSRQMARGGLSTPMRPDVALVVRACHRCLLTDRPLKRCHKTARVAVQFGPETPVATSRRSGGRTAGRRSRE